MHLIRQSCVITAHLVKTKAGRVAGNMNYQLLYNKIMQKAHSRSRPIGYVEKHHIVPKALGGSNNKENIAILTAREHFIAHYLLAKIHGGHMWLPVVIMRKQHEQKGQYINSKLYAIAKQKHAHNMSKVKQGDNRGAVARWSKPGEHERMRIQQTKMQKDLAQAVGYSERISALIKIGMQKAGMTSAEISRRTKLGMQKAKEKRHASSEKSS